MEYWRIFESFQILLQAAALIWAVSFLWLCFLKPKGLLRFVLRVAWILANGSISAWGMFCFLFMREYSQATGNGQALLDAYTVLIISNFFTLIGWLVAYLRWRRPSRKGVLMGMTTINGETHGF